jgi:hypothetical protein
MSFLCHNTKDEGEVREFSRQLEEKNIKPWMDEADIEGGSVWHTTIGQQIETVKSAAVFFGPHGVGGWQSREIVPLLTQSDRRGCPVIPVMPLSVLGGGRLVGLSRSLVQGSDLFGFSIFCLSFPSREEKNCVSIPDRRSKTDSSEISPPRLRN